MTVEPGVRIAAAASVLLAALLAALLFRRDAPETQSATLGSSDRLVLTERPRPQTGGPLRDRLSGGPEWPRSASASTGVAAQRATVLRPMEGGEAPPPLAKDYPGQSVPGPSIWGASLGLLPSAPRQRPAQKHKIVDGDTLPKLAERYLGSADRAWEIYEANRELLPSPELLPIGVELTIPPWPAPTPRDRIGEPKAENGRQKAEGSEPRVRGRLVPVPSGIAEKGSTAAD
jgi:nucleoid-associated protein YgaU